MPATQSHRRAFSFLAAPSTLPGVNTLSIEMSTRKATIALLTGHAPIPLASLDWDQRDQPHQHLFVLLPSFLRKAAIDPARLDQYIIGVGPGSFAGIRVALAAANGLALPGTKPVHGLPSAAALARAFASPNAPRTIAIVGDARRARFWIARYRWDGALLHPDLAPTLIPLDALRAHIPAGALVASPDYDRIAAPLTAATTDHADLLAHNAQPTADTLGALALEWTQAAIPLAPPQPLYLHPAV
jgi:tRNA threonylcarbamoyladenosine biosynthesis protein TsaB